MVGINETDGLELTDGIVEGMLLGNEVGAYFEIQISLPESTSYIPPSPIQPGTASNALREKHSKSPAHPLSESQSP